ncbi:MULTISPECIES: flagellin N-terminal helical domain-containing protein [unclassified Bacillus (in: firmicutes)]|uniref:flagellin N-terminal helical domain-containing protein n=1 Tax=unclassified Bacillus (in: firmicutes) TaxID=185979 RepID=UPI00232FB5BB|nr:flagellin [Bacillus sp. BP-3]MDC2865767.1 flagellin [Bacillus sp. BP-3]
MRINTNVNSMRTQEYMRQNQDKMNTAMNRLSSGKRINSAADDAAGLAIATRMRSKEGGLEVGARNTQDGMSLLRTADSALGSVSNILLRMRDLATQSANGTNQQKDQDSLDLEFQALAKEIDHISDKTNFNGNTILDKTGGGKDVDLQLSDVSGDTLTISAVDADSKTLMGGAVGDLKSAANAKTAMDAVDTAIQTVADARATFGSQLNRLDHNLNNVTSQATSMAAAASQIEDADMAKEMSEMTKFKILNDAGISMLSQANQTPQMVSKLLQ